VTTELLEAVLEPAMVKWVVEMELEVGAETETEMVVKLLFISRFIKPTALLGGYGGSCVVGT